MADLETIKASPPLDFGSGSVVIRNSQCLRNAKLPSDCDICVSGCPAGAIAQNAGSAQIPDFVGEKDGRLFVDDTCLKCGLCVELCPVGAVSVTRAGVRDILLRLMGATLRDGQLTISCKQAAAALPATLQAQVLEVPCLADLGAELWFYALVETGIANIVNIVNPAAGVGGGAGGSVGGNAGGDASGNGCHVFLPLDICADCPVNCDGLAEQMYMEAIGLAENWSGQVLDLLVAAQELAALGKKSLLENLQDSQAGGRREVLEGLFGKFRQSWQDAGDTLGQGKDKLKQIVAQRERNARLSGVDLLNDRSTASFGPGSIGGQAGGGRLAGQVTGQATGQAAGQVDTKKIPAKRKALIAALQDVVAEGVVGVHGVRDVQGVQDVRDAQIVQEPTAKYPPVAQPTPNYPRVTEVTILVSTTCYSKCNGCGKCVDACPVKARRMVNGNSAILFSDLSPKTGPAAAEVSYVDTLACTGCSACIQHCPTAACVYSQVSGMELLKLMSRNS